MKSSNFLFLFFLCQISASYQESWDISRNKDSEGFTSLSLHVEGLEYYTHFFAREDRPTKITDGENLIWRGNNKKKCLGYVVHYEKGVPALVKLFTFGSNSAILMKYSERIVTRPDSGQETVEWRRIKMEEHKEKTRKLYNLPNSKNYILNVRSKNSRNFEVKEIKTQDLYTTEYTLITAASVTKVIYGPLILWENQEGEECHRVSVDHDGGDTAFIRILIINPLYIGKQIYFKVKGDSHMQITYRYYFSWLLSRVREPKETPTNPQDEADGACNKGKELEQNVPSILDINSTDSKQFFISRIGKRSKCHRKYIPKSGHIAKVVEYKKELWRAREGEICHTAILLFRSRRPSLFTLHIRNLSGEETSICFTRSGGLWRAQKVYEEILDD